MWNTQDWDNVETLVQNPDFIDYFKRPPVIEGLTTEPTINIDCIDYLMFCNGNYLGMANDQDVMPKVVESLAKYGLTASGSRWVCGTQTPHIKLEQAIADHQGEEDAVLFFLVTVASQGAIRATIKPPLNLLSFASKSDLPEEQIRTEIFIDQHSHPSLFDAVNLASVDQIHQYKHNDMDSLCRHLKRSERENSGSRVRRMIVTDGVNSAFGDLAPLPDIVEIAKKFDCLVAVDDAHGTGVFGETGRGLWEHFGVADQIDLKIGSLAKAFAGGLGGFVTGCKNLTDFLRPTAGHYMFGGSIPPAMATAITAIIEKTSAEPWRRSKCLENAHYLLMKLAEMGFDTFGSQSQVIPIRIGDEAKGLSIFRKLLDNRILAPCFRYPAVPRGEARIRVNPTALHSRDQLDEFLHAFAAAARSVDLPA